jgi:hypothetical protein
MRERVRRSSPVDWLVYPRLRYYAGLAAPMQTRARPLEAPGLLPDARPSIVSPSVNNSGSDKRHDVGDHGGGNDHLSLSRHHTQGFERFEVQWVFSLLRLGALSP